eukprot:comp20392_c0_seq1/m.25791 comp20392_c0_seq1/g.25791  ORF comp20392_c0_seq1/g.25791 comp20392_c0_seq1/m.25791 type:complete len:327 (-) comp20392_c0_seq1:235-1215(-)
MNTKRVLLLALCALAACSVVVAEEAKQDTAPVVVASEGAQDAEAAPPTKEKKVKKKAAEAAAPEPAKEEPVKEEPKKETPPPAPAKADVIFSDVTVAVKDAAGLGSPVDVPYPSGLSKPLTVEKKGSLQLKFVPSVDSADQLFVRLTNTATGTTKTFASGTAGIARAVTIDLTTKEARKIPEGTYRVEILAAGQKTNAVVWTAATVTLQTGAEAKSDDQTETLKELNYTFEEGPKQPNAFIANVFTLLCAAPFAGLLITWGGIGVNLKGMTLSPSALVFHLSVAGIIGIFTLFWIRLTMFETLYYLAPVSLVAFLSGNQFLKHHQL